MSQFRVIFVASDYDSTVEFFADVVGLKVHLSFAESFRGTIFAAAAGFIEIIEDSAGSRNAGFGTPGVSGVTVSWQVNNIDAEHSRLVSAGAQIVHPPELQPWGHKSLEVTGPDGLRIILFEIMSHL